MPWKSKLAHSVIHSGYFYSASSSPLLLRGTPDYSIDTVLKLTHQSATGNCEWRTCPRYLCGGYSWMPQLFFNSWKRKSLKEHFISLKCRRNLGRGHWNAFLIGILLHPLQACNKNRFCSYSLNRSLWPLWYQVFYYLLDSWKLEIIEATSCVQKWQSSVVTQLT